MKVGAAGSWPRLHVVTNDPTLGRDDFLRVASEIVEAGAERVVLHVRGPGTSGRRIWEFATELAAVARHAGATLMVNDRVDVALALDSAGVQLGGRSLPLGAVRPLLKRGAPIGASCHSPEEAGAAARRGATFVLAGHVFETSSHAGVPGRGIDWLAEVVRAAGGVPVVGIGGVTTGRVADVLSTGAAGVAAVSGVWDSTDPVAAVVEYIHRLSAAANQ